MKVPKNLFMVCLAAFRQSPKCTMTSAFVVQPTEKAMNAREKKLAAKHGNDMKQLQIPNGIMSALPL